MTIRLIIHPQNPQLRLIRQAAESIQAGKVIVYPTDSGYALGCQIGDKLGSERIRRLRNLPEQHHFTLVCYDLSQLANYARVDNPSFRLLKAYTPGPYTFILPASKEVPRRLQHPKRKTVGLRVPNHVVALALLQELKQALMSVTLILPGDEKPLDDIDEICEKLEGQVELIIDAGYCGSEPTSVIDLTSGIPKVIRVGQGDVSGF